MLAEKDDRIGVPNYIRISELAFSIFILTGLFVPGSPADRFFSDVGLGLAWFDSLRGLEKIIALGFSFLLLYFALFFSGTKEPLMYVFLHLIKTLLAVFLFVLAIPASFYTIVNENYRIYLEGHHNLFYNAYYTYLYKLYHFQQ